VFYCLGVLLDVLAKILLTVLKCFLQNISCYLLKLVFNRKYDVSK
jgi:hypothetical protein